MPHGPLRRQAGRQACSDYARHMALAFIVTTLVLVSDVHSVCCSCVDDRERNALEEETPSSSAFFVCDCTCTNMMNVSI